jgi:hypothetical protein
MRSPPFFFAAKADAGFAEVKPPTWTDHPAVGSSGRNSSTTAE